jgi:DNA-directed RNA polymerase specialized sigma24 family protein
MADHPGEQPVTTLLLDWRHGNREAGNQLMARMQPELRRIAAGYMQRERSGHTLQTTALVNELFLKLMGGATVEWQDRAHFLAVASQQLRRILVDQARERQAEKRGGGALATTLLEESAITRPFEGEPARLASCPERVVRIGFPRRARDRAALLRWPYGKRGCGGFGDFYRDP